MHKTAEYLNSLSEILTELCWNIITCFQKPEITYAFWKVGVGATGISLLCSLI